MDSESIFIRNCSAREFRKEGHKEVPSPLSCHYFVPCAIFKPKGIYHMAKGVIWEGIHGPQRASLWPRLGSKLMALISSSEPPVGPRTPIGSNNNHPYFGKELSPGGSSGSSWKVLTSPWPPAVPCPRTPREVVLQGRSPDSPLNRKGLQETQTE